MTVDAKYNVKNDQVRYFYEECFQSFDQSEWYLNPLSNVYLAENVVKFHITRRSISMIISFPKETEHSGNLDGENTRYEINIAEKYLNWLFFPGDVLKKKDGYLFRNWYDRYSWRNPFTVITIQLFRLYDENLAKVVFCEICSFFLRAI